MASYLILPQSWKAGTFVITPILQTGKLRCSFRADALAEALRVPHSPTPSPQDTACLGQARLRPPTQLTLPDPRPWHADHPAPPQPALLLQAPGRVTLGLDPSLLLLPSS